MVSTNPVPVDFLLQSLFDTPHTSLSSIDFLLIVYI